MPTEDFVKLGPGTLYVDGIAYNGLKEIQFEYATEEDYKRGLEARVLTLDTSFEATMEWVASLRKITFLKLCGDWQWAIDNCPNKRIVHLMRHGKNDRIKLKNYNRALREIAKYVSKRKGGIS